MMLEFQVKDCVSSKGEKATLVEFNIPSGVLAPSALSELSPPQLTPGKGLSFPVEAQFGSMLFLFTTTTPRLGLVFLIPALEVQ